MPYAQGRRIFDADSHVVETPDWLDPWAEPYVRERMAPLFVASVKPGEESFIDQLRRKHQDPEYRAADEAEIMLRKNWSATGSFLKEDRPRALDLLGFEAQLVFHTFMNGMLLTAEKGDDLDYAYGLARAHNKAIVDFCSVDPRLLPVGYVPLADFERTKAFAAEAIDTGCKALMIPSACPRNHSPSHIGLFPLWDEAQDAGLPIIFHVGGGGQLLDPMYFENGLPKIKDFHGGDENFRSVDYMAIPYTPMQTLATLIIDGILDRYPRLMFGVIEQGGSWAPGWMRMLDSARDAFHKNEERLQRLELKPSEYVQRQVRITPYPSEDAGWIIEQTGPDVCMFSSDFPHVEGGRNPLARFERTTSHLDEDRLQKFYCDNFVDLMGSALSSTAFSRK